MLKKLQYWLIVLFTFGSGCKSGLPDKQQVLAIREMGNLASTEYTITKLVKASDDKTWYKIGDRKILISCRATIKAGVDLSKLTKDDVEISGKKITLRLPEPTVLSLNMAPENIKVEHQEIGMLRTGFDNAERDALLRQAEVQINKSIDELGILNTAKQHSSLFLDQFLRKLGFTEVTIQYGPKTSTSKPLS